MLNLPLTHDFTGKVVVVTGAGGVLCGEMAKALAACGAKVALLGRTLEPLEKVAAEIAAEGGVARPYSANVLDRAALEAADILWGDENNMILLEKEGFTIALVADGEWESFQNVYRKNGLGYCFDAWIVSEVVGKQKPEPIMFETAFEKLNLTDSDRSRIVMIGNNLKKTVR